MRYIYYLKHESGKHCTKDLFQQIDQNIYAWKAPVFTILVILQSHPFWLPEDIFFHIQHRNLNDKYHLSIKPQNTKYVLNGKAQAMFNITASDTVIKIREHFWSMESMND